MFLNYIRGFNELRLHVAATSDGAVALHCDGCLRKWLPDQDFVCAPHAAEGHKAWGAGAASEAEARRVEASESAAASEALPGALLPLPTAGWYRAQSVA